MSKKRHQIQKNITCQFVQSRFSIAKKSTLWSFSAKHCATSDGKREKKHPKLGARGSGLLFFATCHLAPGARGCRMLFCNKKSSHQFIIAFFLLNPRIKLTRWANHMPMRTTPGLHQVLTSYVWLYFFSYMKEVFKSNKMLLQTILAIFPTDQKLNSN